MFLRLENLYYPSFIIKEIVIRLTKKTMDGELLCTNLDLLTAHQHFDFNTIFDKSLAKFNLLNIKTHRAIWCKKIHCGAICATNLVLNTDYRQYPQQTNENEGAKLKFFKNYRVNKYSANNINLIGTCSYENLSHQLLLKNIYFQEKIV